MRSENSYAILSDDCSIRRLETPCVYNKAADELYELDEEGLRFLQRCDGSKRLCELGGDPEFVRFCLGEGILATLRDPHVRHYTTGKSPDVSLRYLELHLTGRCNLRCRHCYLDAGDGEDLELLKVFKVMEEFDAMQGLRLLISGGEPLMHRGFWYINERLADYGFRGVLLTNGTLVGRETASRLKVYEAQVSLDGMRASHDALRGHGSFGLAVRGIEDLSASGIKVAVATTVNALNLPEMDELSGLVEALGVSEWNVDMPAITGRMAGNKELHVTPAQAAPYMSYGLGGSHHGGPEGYACGAHLCAVGAKGQVAKCGFYLDRPVGQAAEGLALCWSRIRPVRLGELSCDCEYVEACRGGCRFRAAAFMGEFGPDPVKCHNLGVMPRDEGQAGA